MSKINSALLRLKGLETEYTGAKFTSHVAECLKMSRDEVKSFVKGFLAKDTKRLDLFLSFLLDYLGKIQRNAFAEFGAVVLPESARLKTIIAQSDMTVYLRKVCIQRIILTLACTNLRG